MLLEILNQDNYISYNVKLATLFGLEGAVYCSVLLSIYQKAYKKNKLIDDKFFKVDRKYIYEKTMIPIENQLNIDLNWIKISLLTKNVDNPDIISLDINLIASLISNEDQTIIKNISKKLKVKSPKGTRETKRQVICNTLKDGIICSNYELLTALRDWVDAIFSNPNNFLSKKSVEVFQQTLNNYCKIPGTNDCDLDKALNIVRIAAAQGYKDCSWAINYYEKGLRIKQTVDSKLPRVTEQKVVLDDTDLSEEVF